MEAKLRRISGRIALTAIMTAAPLATAPASAGPDDVQSTGCVEFTAFVTVPVDRVDPYVPDDYVFTTFPGDALTAAGVQPGGVAPVTDLIVRSYHCDKQIVDGNERADTTSVLFGPQVAFPPDGTEFGFYTMFVITDNLDLVKWFRRGTAMPQIHHVPGLQFTMETLAPGASKTVVDAQSAPWPFKLSGVLGEPGPVDTDFEVYWWGPVPGSRTLLFKNEIVDFYPRGGWGLIEAEPGTPMANMFGGHEAHAYFISGRFDFQRTTKRLSDPPVLN